MIQFYAPEIENTQVLPEGESVHCARVLRMKAGDEIIVTDGKGFRYVCEIVSPHPVHTTFVIKEKIPQPSYREYKITLAVAPTKNPDRMEWMAEKCVELGVDRIVFLKCKRSERKLIKTERIRKVMVAAMKQSLSSILPELSDIKNFNEFLQESDPDTQKFFGYCSDAFPRKNFVCECKGGKDLIVMIGPEGDFTEEEVDNAIKSGFMPVTFGNRRLRTETAAVYALSATIALNQLSAEC